MHVVFASSNYLPNKGGGRQTGHGSRGVELLFPKTLPYVSVQLALCTLCFHSCILLASFLYRHHMVSSTNFTFKNAGGYGSL